PDARRGQVERGGRAEPAGADQEDPRLEQLELALVADLGDQQVAAVAAALLRRERLRELRREAVALPVGVAAGERPDALVAELLERLRGERRAAARGAVHEDRPVAIRQLLLDARLEVPARDVDRAGDVPV